MHGNYFWITMALCHLTLSPLMSTKVDSKGWVRLVTKVDN